MLKCIISFLALLITFGNLKSQSLRRSTLTFYGLTADNVKGSSGQIANGYTANAAGSYLIGFQQPLAYAINTSLSVLADTVLCSGSRLLVKAGKCFGYRWYKNDSLLIGQNADSLSIISAGTYKLVGYDGAIKYDTSKTIRVTMLPKPAKPGILSFQKDTVLCFNDTIRLTSSSTYDRYLWSTGDTTKSILANSPAAIVVRGGTRIGSSSDYCYSDSSIIITTRKNLTPAPSLIRVADDLVSSQSQNYRWFMNNLPSPVNNGSSYRIVYKGFYAVETSLDKLCWSRSKNYIVQNDLASTDQKDYLLSAYPNPTSGFFFLQAKLGKRFSGFMQLAIVDQNGATQWIIKKFIFNENNIRIPINLKLNKGTYSVQVKINGYRTQVIKIIAL